VSNFRSFKNNVFFSFRNMEETCEILIKTEDIVLNYDADTNADANAYDDANADAHADANADANAYDDAFKFSDEPMEENPWAVDSLSRFIFYNCPECDFKAKDEPSFQNHAVEFHYQVQFSSESA
jgi:hypothetical protein